MSRPACVADAASEAAERTQAGRADRLDALVHLIGTYRTAEARLAADPDDARTAGEMAFLLVDLDARALQVAADARHALDELAVSS
jgi:hypothetical protein